MQNKLIDLALFLCALFSGVYAGIGFFSRMGFNPTLELLSDSTFAECWQHLDHFMASRMRIFGPILILTLLLGVIVLFKEFGTASFWLLLAALAVMLTDVAFTLSTNHPLNQTIQSWDLKNLPGNVQEIKWRVVKAFQVRTILMMVTFVLVLLAVWLRKSR